MSDGEIKLYDDDTLEAMKELHIQLLIAKSEGKEEEFKQMIRRERDKQEAIEHLHNARCLLGVAGFHGMAREVASLINEVSKANPDAI